MRMRLHLATLLLFGLVAPLIAANDNAYQLYQSRNVYEQHQPAAAAGTSATATAISKEYLPPTATSQISQTYLPPYRQHQQHQHQHVADAALVPATETRSVAQSGANGLQTQLPDDYVLARPANAEAAIFELHTYEREQKERQRLEALAGALVPPKDGAQVGSAVQLSSELPDNYILPRPANAEAAIFELHTYEREQKERQRQAALQKQQGASATLLPLDKAKSAAASATGASIIQAELPENYVLARPANAEAAIFELHTYEREQKERQRLAALKQQQQQQEQSRAVVAESENGNALFEALPEDYVLPRPANAEAAIFELHTYEREQKERKRQEELRRQQEMQQQQQRTAQRPQVFAGANQQYQQPQQQYLPPKPLQYLPPITQATAHSHQYQYQQYLPPQQQQQQQQPQQKYLPPIPSYAEPAGFVPSFGYVAATAHAQQQQQAGRYANQRPQLAKAAVSSSSSSSSSQYHYANRVQTAAAATSAAASSSSAAIPQPSRYYLPAAPSAY